MYSTISFYKYIDIKNPQWFKNQVRGRCIQFDLLGRILLGKEGINGAVSGKTEKIKLFKSFLQEKFPELTFREQQIEKNSYHKLIVRVRNEICVFGQNVDLKNTGNHLKVQELEQWYQEGKKFTIVDARNDYEFDVGHFKNAIRLPIKTFKEFPNVAPKVLQDKKEETIVLYCTGGVRCEKASAYLKESGFMNVYQVDGGIINYTNEFKNHEKTESSGVSSGNNWQGGLFVFDDRLVQEGRVILNKCSFCETKTDLTHDCFNLDCDKLFLSCKNCLEKMKNTCSEECLHAPKHRKVIEKKEMIGKVINYYTKLKVASVHFNQEVPEEVYIKGKTTNFFQHINEFKVDEKGIVSFQVKNKVRKNDKVLI